MSKFHVDLQMRWADQDAYGHINNVAQARYLEEARIRTFFTGATREETKLAGFFRTDTEDGLKMLVASQTVDYKLPLEYSSELLEVEMWIGRMGGSSLDVYSQIISPSQGRAVTTVSKTVSVVVDGLTLKPVRLSDEAREAAEPWMGDPLKVGR